MTFSQASSKEIPAVLTELGSDTQGLSSVAAQERIARDGKNEIHSLQTTWRHILLRQFKSPFIYLLAGAAALALALGEVVDGLMIVLFIGINVALSFSQEYHSEKTVRLLKQFIGSRCRVLRDKQWLLLPSAELATGDIVRIEAGDIVPADIRIIEDQSLTLDESTFTGESVAVRKTATPLPHPAQEVYQAENCAFSGSTVVSGEGLGVVFATGGKTAIGSLTKLTAETVRESNFEKGIARFSRFILRLVVVTLVIMTTLHLVIQPGQTPIFELILFAIALAVSVIPEALPVVMTVCLSRGARRLAQNHVVVKRLSAIEDLGGIEVLCTDKTGTLTQNKLTVADVYADNRSSCLNIAALASAVIGDTKQQANNSFDIAIWRALTETERNQTRTAKRLAEIPFDPQRRRNSVLVSHYETKQLVLRGAPESILPYLHLSTEERRKIDAWLLDQGTRGRRVLAISARTTALQHGYTPTDEEQNQALVGIIAFEDPIKPSAAHAIQEAQRLGVAVTILTGDHPDVARAVACEVGLMQKKDRVMTGEEWEALTHEQRNTIVKTCHVFARVSPEQKYHIIQHLEEAQAVGFLGEGINDAPALKMAHVGIAVKEASDVAREASDVILLENSLDVIVQGIREGREVFANTVKYIRMTLAANFGNFYAIAAASFLIDVLPMLPIQILLVNLLSDFPMIAIATDRVDAEEMKKPRSYHVHEIVMMATVLGLVSTLFDFVFFGAFRHRDPDILRTQWFIGSILTELIFLYSVRTKRVFFRGNAPSPILVGLTALAAIATVVTPYTAFGAHLFSFVRPHFSDLLLTLGIVAVFFLTTEIVKLLYVHVREEVHTS